MGKAHALDRIALLGLGCWLLLACDEPQDPSEATGSSGSETGVEGTQGAFSGGGGGSSEGGDVLTGSSTESSGGTTDHESSGSSDGASEPPGADTVPGGGEILCGNQVLPFDPPWDLVGPSAEDAYWMMWFARRTTLFGQPEVPAELAALGLDDYEEFDVPTLGLQAFVVSNDDAVILAFRGSQDVTDWLVNFSFAQVSGVFYGLDGQVHLGFASALQSAYEPISTAVEERASGGKPVWVTGHSLGGAMAMLAATRLSQAGLTMGPVYVFGQPRSGNQVYAASAQAELGGRVYRFVNERDVVPRIPPAGAASAEAGSVLPLLGGAAESLISQLDYAHVGTMFHFVDDAVIEYPPMDDGEDVEYWSQLDSEGWLALVSATQVGTWHLHDQYLCRLRAWAFGS